MSAIDFYKGKWVRHTDEEVIAAYADYIQSKKTLLEWAGHRDAYTTWRSRFKRLGLPTIMSRCYAAQRPRKPNQRAQLILLRWQAGEAFTTIAADYGLTRQRIDQIAKRELRRTGQAWCTRCRRPIETAT